VTAALLLLLLEVTAPLGPYARPGVPVPLIVKNETVLDLEGWKYAATSPLTLVHPPVVPCTVRDANGKELLRLEAVPEKTLLVGVQGQAPPDYAERIPRAEGWKVIVVPGVDPAAARRHLYSLAVFDRVVFRARSAEEFANPAELVPLALRRPNRAPEVYDAIPRSDGPSDALGLARLIGIGAGAVLALQILLAWRGFTSLKVTVLGIGFVALAGALFGVLTVSASYEPIELFRIDVQIRSAPPPDKDGVSRVDATLIRLGYACYVARGPGGVAVPERGWTPLFYRAPGDPWWSGPDRKMEIEEGVMRLFLIGSQESAAPGEAGDGEAAADLSELAKWLQPPGEWQVSILGWHREKGRSPRTALISFRPRN